MSTFIVLGSFTDQGRRTIKGSPMRLDAARKVLEKTEVGWSASI